MVSSDGRQGHLAPCPITDDAQHPPTSGTDKPTPPEADVKPDPKLGDAAQRLETGEDLLPRVAPTLLSLLRHPPPLQALNIQMPALHPDRLPPQAPILPA